MNREIFNIAIPAIVTNVTIPLLGLLDTAIAGHLPGGSGATFIGAVAVGAMMFNLIYWNFGFLGSRHKPTAAATKPKPWLCSNTPWRSDF